MSLKESRGNMYDWVTHMHSHLGGECPHKCTYCYVQKNRFGVSPRYQGNLRLIIDELKVNYGENKIIFIEHMNDMFAKEVKRNWITEIFIHCNNYPLNQYVFQTKNPLRAYQFLEYFPPQYMIGTTIETNKNLPEHISLAPQPIERIKGIALFAGKGLKTFITIEPILDFDVGYLGKWIELIKPDFVNIGADSKNCGLIEPSKEKVLALIKYLQAIDITIKKKVNLRRLGINMEQ